LPRLPPGLMPRVLRCICELEEGDRVPSLIALVPRLPDELFPTALDEILRVYGNRYSQVLCDAIYRHVPRSAHAHALRVARKISDEQLRGQAIGRLIPVVDDGLLAEARAEALR